MADVERGKVVRIVRDRGFMFIKADSDKQDIFAHMSSVKREPGFSFDSITEGVRVEFEREDSDKGPRATNVTRE